MKFTHWDIEYSHHKLFGYRLHRLERLGGEFVAHSAFMDFSGFEVFEREEGFLFSMEK
jgi:hypothetical protein